jgi:1-aminocyclopropane-1-carboxylate deaminase
MIDYSPIQTISFDQKQFFIKRDDLLDQDFSGNKGRKLLYFLDHPFPHIDTLISHGSNQSNAMYSLSVLAKRKGWRFIYYTDHIPSYLENNPIGNYQMALANGMELRFGDGYLGSHPSSTLCIKEGGAIQEAQYGIMRLANEIKEWKEQQSITNLKIFLPSGTGTTALYLQSFLKDEVLTVPCVGDREYLLQQFHDLEPDLDHYPTILKPLKKYHFGKLYPHLYQLWKRLNNETLIEFDLLYDPIGWETLLHYHKEYANCTLMYIHQGGVIGNISMVERYKRKYDKISKN